MNKITLTINKKKYNFRLGLGAIGELANEFDIDQDEIFNNIGSNVFYYAPRLMYAGYKYDFLRSGKVIDVTYNEFLDEVEDSKEFYTVHSIKLVEAFLKSIQNELPNQEGSASKKK